MPKLNAARRLLPVGALIAAIGILISGCTLSSRLPDEKVVLTTFTVLADIASNVAGDRLRVESITKPGAEIHGYEPTPGDVRRTATASLVVDNGLNLEAWFGQFVEGLDVEHVVAGDGIAPIDIASDAYAGKPNPHAWMSPVNVGIYVDNLVDAFTDLDPPEAPRSSRRTARRTRNSCSRCRPNWSPHSTTCRPTNAHWSPAKAPSPTSHATPGSPSATSGRSTPSSRPPRSRSPRPSTSSQEPGAGCLLRVDRLRRSDAAGRRRHRRPLRGGTLYVDSLSEADGPPVPTYLDLIRHDARTIVSGLTGDNR